MTSTLIIPPTLTISQEQFELLATANRDLRLERSPTGELIIMPPTGGNTGRRNAKLITYFVNWNDKNKLGEVFDSSTAFRLPDGSNRSPDVAWVSRERWQSLTPEQQDNFPPLCPDFVVELRSKSDSLKNLQDKMQEYLENGLQLGWLIDIQNQTVEVYRPQQACEVLQKPILLTGESVLRKFSVSLDFLWL
ncbi:MAG: Uma2 family endonuclease [Woronichinia naegeliana WA131]|jgi:Uma2 family endonuclease|uniref:Uma2 family endonuclease n=1 Tax=Woronichinia naegeliana WA131 TaxID=2824559 RepID=A0A977KUP2_9CYAN|nr:MAG: Uma2 family endonuclease [Woronichinia naegeliana WA131]